jgi:hypothetical protein
MVPLFLIALVSSSHCAIEDARYQLRTAPQITASFQDIESGADWPAHLALQLHIGATGRYYWFLPWNGGTDGRAHLASTTNVKSTSWRAPSPDAADQRPIGDIDYIGTDASYTVLEGVPKQKGIAPSHMLLPNLGDALWHLASPDRRDSAPNQFFDLVSCIQR